MNNSEAIDRFDQANSAWIEKLFWIAGSSESREFQSLLEDMDENDWKECLPEIAENEHFEEYESDRELHQLLLEQNKFGFIAEVSFPKNYDFFYNEKGEVAGGSLHIGIRSIAYVYAETPEELLIKVEKLGKEFFERDIKEDKVKNQPQTTQS